MRALGHRSQPAGCLRSAIRHARDVAGWDRQFRQRLELARAEGNAGLMPTRATVAGGAESDAERLRLRLRSQPTLVVAASRSHQRSPWPQRRSCGGGRGRMSTVPSATGGSRHRVDFSEDERRYRGAGPTPPPPTARMRPTGLPGRRCRQRRNCCNGRFARPPPPVTGNGGRHDCPPASAPRSRAGVTGRRALAALGDRDAAAAIYRQLAGVSRLPRRRPPRPSICLAR